jgi:hypothetical protein
VRFPHPELPAIGGIVPPLFAAGGLPATLRFTENNLNLFFAFSFQLFSAKVETELGPVEGLGALSFSFFSAFIVDVFCGGSFSIMRRTVSNCVLSPFIS